MSKLSEARLASLEDKIYQEEIENEVKSRKNRKKLKLKGRGSGRTSRIKRKKK